MRQMIQDFKSIMTDRKERNEFIVGFACVMTLMALLYMMIVLFH